MPNRNPVPFRRSILAVAIVSLSACSTTPRLGDFDAGQLGSGLARAGRTTIDAGVRVWDEAAYLLGFGEDRPSEADNVLIDEVDLALMEEDAVMPGDTTLSPVIVQNATVATNQTPTNSAITVVADAAPAESADLVAADDLVHEVSSSETLWDIAKKTTGDANNWHILADVNNLAPNAAVFPGQQLTIPADMVKPVLHDNSSVLSTQKAGADLPGTQIPKETSQSSSELDSADAPASASTAVAADKRLEIPTPENKVAVVPEKDGAAFELKAGETLWDFAKRTTGDATNWQAIAGQNLFTEKQAVLVQPGQRIYVPNSLVKPELAAASSQIKTPTNDSLTADGNDSGSISVSDDRESILASSAVLLGTNTLDETQPIRIVEAAYKGGAANEGISTDQLVDEASQALNSTNPPRQIMVSGTYYPKAVYNDADFSSSLLMRVSPGTTLKVSKAMGPWFEVETDKGTGYVHQRDIK